MKVLLQIQLRHLRHKYYFQQKLINNVYEFLQNKFLLHTVKYLFCHATLILYWLHHLPIYLFSMLNGIVMVNEEQSEQNYLPKFCNFKILVWRQATTTTVRKIIRKLQGSILMLYSYIWEPNRFDYFNSVRLNNLTMCFVNI